MTNHHKAIRDYSTDSLVKILHNFTALWTTNKQHILPFLRSQNTHTRLQLGAFMDSQYAL